MRLIRVFLAAAVVSACRQNGDEPLRKPDGTMLSSSGGEVELSDGSKLQFVITSERYKQWSAAQSGLSPAAAARFGALLQPKTPTEKSIARATAFLETDAASRQAIERTGMRIKDFVLMTVALEQEMRLAGSQGTERPSRPAPVPVPSSEPEDTTFAAARVRSPVDSASRADTITPSRRDTTARRDSVLSPPKPPRDTVRDSTTLSRTDIPRA